MVFDFKSQIIDEFARENERLRKAVVTGVDHLLHRVGRRDGEAISDVTLPVSIPSEVHCVRVCVCVSFSNRFALQLITSSTTARATKQQQLP